VRECYGRFPIAKPHRCRRRRARFSALNNLFISNRAIDGLYRILDFDESFSQVLSVAPYVLLSQCACGVAPLFNLSVAGRNKCPNVLVFLGQSSPIGTFAAIRRASSLPICFYSFCDFAPGPSHFSQNFLLRFCLSFCCHTVTLRSKLAIFIRRSHVRIAPSSSGSLAMLAAIRISANTVAPSVGLATWQSSLRSFEPLPS
jgi:hypothetical protein